MAAPYQSKATHSFEPAARIAATDPKMLRRRSIEPSLAHKWREVALPAPLGLAAQALARAHGYELVPELPAGLEWLSRAHAASGEPPLLCVHDFTGGLWAYGAVVRQLRVPCLGVHTSRQQLEQCRAVSQLAERYLARLPLGLWPAGSAVRLLGYSFGCRVVHRLARLLEASGRRVDLILLDGPIGAGIGGVAGGGARGGGNAPQLEALLAAGGGLPPELERVLDLAGEGARENAMALMALPDPEPEGGEAGGAGPAAPALYVAATGSHNTLNGTPDEVCRCRPGTTVREVGGTHFDFLGLSAAEVAQAVNGFLEERAGSRRASELEGARSAAAAELEEARREAKARMDEGLAAAARAAGASP
jgi:hypothetical protein